MYGRATRPILVGIALSLVLPLQPFLAQESSKPRPGSLSLRPAGTNRLESLALKPRSRISNTTDTATTAATVPSAGYLEAWSAIHNDSPPTEEARNVDSYLRSEADPRALRSHVQKFIRRRPGAWLASSFSHYPSPTGDRAGAWKRIFPELVSPENDVLKRQVAFDALLRLFEGTPDQRAFHEQLAEHANPGMLIRACRNSSLSEAIRQSLTPATIQRLHSVEAEAAAKGLEATAAVVALHAHLLRNKGLPEPRSLPDALATPAPSPVGEQPQLRAARLFAAIWPPLSPSGVESPRLHEILSREASFADIRLQKVFGITPAPLEKQTAAVLSRMPPGSPELALGGQPPKLRMAGLGDAATWSEQDGPELRAQLQRVREARKAEAEGIQAAGWARRFHNPQAYERELAELRGESPRLINSTSVAEAESGLAAARWQQGELMRDGVYVGRDLNRSDRVYTRELNSFERRQLDFQIDVERRRVEDARLNEQYNQRLIAEYRAREQSILNRLNDAYRTIRESEQSWAPRLKKLREQVELEEFKLRRLRGDGVPAAELEARHDAIRVAELKRHRAERIAAMKNWQPTAPDITEGQAGAERLWRAWLTGSDIEGGYVPPAIGGLPVP